MAALLIPGAANAAPGLVTSPVEPCQLAKSNPGNGTGEGFPLAELALPAVGEPLNAAAIYIDFSDAVGTEGELSDTRAEIYNDLQYLNDLSGGTFSINVNETDGWVRMPEPSTEYSFSRQIDRGQIVKILTDAVNAADPDFDFSEIDMLWVYTTRGTTTVTNAARFFEVADEIPQLDGNAIDDAIILGSKRRDLFTLGHEMSHIFGIMDQYTNASNPDYDPALGPNMYVGGFEHMDGVGPEWFAWHRWMIGWLGDAEVACVTEPGTSTVRLRPVEASRSHNPAQDALAVIPFSRTQGVAIESRQPIGYDTRLGHPGVLIYSIDTTKKGGEGPLRVIDANPPFKPGEKFAGLDDAAFQPGESYRDETTRTIVQVLDDEDGAAVIRITRY
ncbi:hypothetical protein ACUOFU_05125 [Microbacterium arabinogalactanolyticum]|uniref:hypothetical protein n=1 Tax=Microbacterium arabinogalactanolyticum TaxID=69365 RepID=UPI0040444368